MASGNTNEWYVKRARETQHRDGEVEIDEGAAVSRNDDEAGGSGAYVQAWVWVPDED